MASPPCLGQSSGLPVLGPSLLVAGCDGGTDSVAMGWGWSMTSTPKRTHHPGDGAVSEVSVASGQAGLLLPKSLVYACTCGNVFGMFKGSIRSASSQPSPVQWVQTEPIGALCSHHYLLCLNLIICLSSLPSPCLPSSCCWLNFISTSHFIPLFLQFSIPLAKATSTALALGIIFNSLKHTKLNPIIWSWLEPISN